MALTIHRAYALPARPADRHKNCVYLIKPQDASSFDIFVVDAQGNAYPNFNEEQFSALFEVYSKSLKTFNIVGTMAERDALVLDQNTLVFVMNTSEDPDAQGSSGMFFYSKASGEFTSVYQSGGTDWNFITGRPNSSAEQIDGAVAASHSHSNLPVLDMLGALNGMLYYNGEPVVKYLLGEATSTW